METDIVVFQYLPHLDAFIVDETFADIVETLGLGEWNHVVFLGRYFMLDNDYGEHWFDNWDEREAIEEKSKESGFDSNELLIINPERMQNGMDGPCHSPRMRKLFWTDVLKSLKLSLDFLCEEARRNAKRQRDNDFDVEQQIAKVRGKYDRRGIRTDAR